MGKPLMLQEADAERIEILKKRLDARTKIAVVRLALDLLERHAEKAERVARWRKAGNGGAREPKGPARVPAPQSSPAPRLMTLPAVAPRRWHVYIVDFEPRVGTKPGKQRPCLAIQPTEFGEAGLRSTVLLPLTTNIERAAFDGQHLQGRSDPVTARLGAPTHDGLDGRLPRRAPVIINGPPLVVHALYQECYGGGSSARVTSQEPKPATGD